jgi:hypothetical protein
MASDAVALRVFVLMIARSLYDLMPYIPQGLEPEIVPGSETQQGPSPFRRRVRTFEDAAGCLQSPNTLRTLKVL